MAATLPCLFLVLLVLSPSRATEQKCLTTASSCDECIMSGPDCAWCTAPRANTRCDTPQGLQKAGCGKEHIESLEGYVTPIETRSPLPVGAKQTRLEPNKVYLFVRPGGNQSYTLYFTPTEQLMEEVTVNASNIPAGVNISFDISPKGNPRSVQMNVEAALQCSSTHKNQSGPWSVLIANNLSPEKVMLQINLLCQCECTQRREEKTDVCRENGVLVCGQCECYQPYSGRFCQKGEEDVSLLACRSGPHAPVCSGRGSCEGGFCLCNTPVDSMERFSGQFCEWSNFQCPQYNKKICRGKGSCEGGTCVCDEGWTGEDCGCTTNVTGCMAYNQQVCNGNGMCECGLCKCKLPFYGPTCEMCFTCPGTCVTRADCVECRGFGTGVKNSSCDRECGFFSLSIVENSDDLPEPGYKTAHCKMRSSAGDFCFFYFTYSFTPSGEHATVARDKDCPSPLK